jgi:serine/threonine protein kinase
MPTTTGSPASRWAEIPQTLTTQTYTRRTVAVVLFADRYEQKTPLGQGGFGVVWRAFDHNQHMEVALKLFKPGSPVIHAYHEARVLTALEGPNVLRVYNADIAEADIPYIATRIASEGSAEDVLVTSSPFGVHPDTAVMWTRQMLVGLSSCHALGLVHRDIKTSNLFLERSDWAMLGDFGLAHPADMNGRVPNGGTPVTTPPEMIQSGYGTYVSDIYATGVTLYRLLTGLWPFDGQTPAEVFAAVVQGSFEPIRDIAPHVSRRLAERVEQAMAYNEADRFQTWQELHDQLGHPNLVRRSWARIAPHAGHTNCWLEAGQGTTHQVCVWQAGGQFEVETRRATGAQSRVQAHCGIAKNQSALAIRLRKTFDHL